MPGSDELERILGACREALAETSPDPDFDQDATVPGEGAPEPEPQPRFGRYQITRRIGKGGMGEVLKAFDPAIRREVAIKLLAPRGKDPGAVVDKFVQEARITGQLEHPNIVPVYELALDGADAASYFSMRLVRGRSLAEVLRELAQAEAEAIGHRPNRRFLTVPPGLRDAYPLGRRLSDFVKVCDAVAFAHSRGVIHRDLKPSNVMVGQFGEVLVVDWGLAKVVGAPDAPAAGEGPPAIDASGQAVETIDGTVIGTPSYMPPEQAEGSVEEVDPRSDVYSLGATLYELLTLRQPYVGESKTDVLAQVVRGRLLPPSRRAPPWRIPRELDAVVLRAMAHAQEDRYPTVEALKADVEAFLEGRTLRAARYNTVQVLGKWIVRHRAFSASVACLVLAATIVLGIDSEQEKLARDRKVRTAVAAARARLESVADATALRRKRSRPATGGEMLGDLSGDWEYWETTAQRQAREESLKAYLDAVSILEKALAVDPGQAGVRRLRRELGLELGRVALLGRNFVLARRAFEDLLDYGASAAEVRDLVASVEAAREEGTRWRAVRLGAMLADVRGGLSRPGRHPAAPLLEDYVREALRYRDPGTVTALSAALLPLVEKAGREGRGARWSREESDTATFVCRVLGSIDLPESVAPLAGWIAVVHDPALATEAGLALCDTRRAEALAPLLAARERFTTDPRLARAWDSIRPRFNRIPSAADVDPAEGALGFVRRGRGRLESGDPAGAKADFDLALAIDPQLGAAYRERGRARSRLGESDLALADLGKAVELDPGDAVAFTVRGGVHADRDDLDSAVSDLARAVEVDPSLAEAHARLGEVLARKGDPPAALAHLSRAIELGSKDPAVALRRARILLERGDAPGAVRDFGLGIQLGPRDPQAYAGRAAALLERGELPGALRDLTFALGLAPQDADLYARRAEGRPLSGDLEGARTDLARSIESDPGRWQVWASYAEVLEDLGRADEARAAVEEARRLKG